LKAVENVVGRAGAAPTQEGGLVPEKGTHAFKKVDILVEVDE